MTGNPVFLLLYLVTLKYFALSFLVPAFKFGSQGVTKIV